MFEVLKDDSTLRNRTTSYLNAMYKRGESTEDKKKSTRPKMGQTERAHGLLKLHNFITTLSVSLVSDQLWLQQIHLITT